MILRSSFEKMGNELYVGTSGGVFFSDNYGQYWTGVNGGLTHASTITLSILGPTIFAGTNYGGVFANATLLSTNPPLTQSVFRLYPNPVSGSEKNITFEISGTEKANALAIYDVLGNQIYFEKLESHLLPFSHQISLPELLTGIYFVKLHTRSGQLTQKLLIQ